MKKEELSDVTFQILVRLDSIERMENTHATVNYLTDHFNASVNVWECSVRNNGYLQKLIGRKINYTFKEDHDPVLYRTKYLNQMIRSTQTPFVAIWDTDVIAPVKQVTDSVKLLRDGQVDFVYPYDSRFLDTSDIIRNIYLDTGDISILETNFRRMKSMYTPNPVGGAFFCNLQSYMNSGLENEKFYGWGVEDGERFIRWKNLGYKIQRIEGILYHLTHPRGLNSCVHHPSQSIIKYRELRASHRLISEK